ncbi:hypothetical protein PHMEG_0001391 [Phytophthora megakarya]|uniref:EF-hand domain-containing protein n=1 Tax=Phytophthora megakarya TaxID=4795 RepID=A0A225X1C8_9STRA|nr:hypothetical protein PHMEG_0001391 [Phytophthora megakarya]
MMEEVDARPRRARATRSSAKPLRRELSKPSNDSGGSSADEEEEEEEEEEEIEEEEEEPPIDEADEAELDALDAAYRISPTARELHTLEKGTLVRVLTTPDVEQRVPHTIQKVGVVEEVPMHPNTWFKVRIRDGDVVYKYRPSALEVLEDGDEASSPAASPVLHQEVEEEAEEEEIEPPEVERKEVEDGPLEPGTRVQVKLGPLNAVEKRYLRTHDGKEGVVSGRGKGGVMVQLDGDEELEVRVHQKHLVVVPDEVDDGNDDEEEEEQDEEKPAVVHKKRRGKGKLLSALDPDMWIDRKCRINVGKFKGQHGRVLRSGNGWVQLKLENSSENTAKRAYELTLLEDMETIKILHAKTLEKERKRRAENRANGIGLRGGDGDDEDDDDEGGHSGTDDPLVGDQTEDSQGEDNGKRSRRVSTRGNYGISWIEKKVNLPNRKGYGIVKKADRDTCTVEIQTTKVLQVFKKRDLELASDDHTKTARQNSRNRNNVKAREKLGLGDDVVLMGTTPSRYIAFQDLVKRFAMRRRDKLKKRPNLIEWQARLNLNYLENGFWDKNNPSVIDLVVVAQCEICGVEKEDKDGHCWNNECPRCPAFDVDAFDAKSANPLMRVPVAPFVNNSITSSLCLEKEDLSRKRKRKSLDATATGASGTKQVGTEQVTSPTSESKKAKTTKSKNTPVTTNRDAETKPGGASTDQSEPKRSKTGASKSKPEESSRTETPNTSEGKHGLPPVKRPALIKRKSSSLSVLDITAGAPDVEMKADLPRVDRHAGSYATRYSVTTARVERNTGSLQDLRPIKGDSGDVGRIQSPPQGKNADKKKKLKRGWPSNVGDSLPAVAKTTQEGKPPSANDQRLRRRRAGDVVLTRPATIEVVVKYQLGQHELKKFKTCFKQIDLDASGVIDYDEFFEFIDETKTPFSEGLFRMIDSDSNGSVSTIAFDIATTCN